MTSALPGAADSFALACASVAAAPAPALVTCADRVFVNTAAARWLNAVDSEVGPQAGTLNEAHALTASLRQAARQAAATAGAVEVPLPGRAPVVLTASALGPASIAVQVAWLQTAPADEDVGMLQDRLRLAADSALIGLFEHDLTTGVGVWDHACCTMVGMDPATTVPDEATCLSVVHPADRQRVAQMYERLRGVPIGTDYIDEYRVVRADDGALRHLEERGRVIAGRGGRGRRLIGVLIDVSARHAEQAARRALDEQLHQLADAASIGFGRFDPATGKTEWNAQMYALRGVDPAHEPLSPRGMLDLVHPDDRPQAQQAAALLDAGAPLTQRLRVLLPDSRIRWIYLRCQPTGGERPLIASVAVDFSDLQRAEARSAELADWLSLAIESADIGTWSIDMTTGKVHWNANQYALLLMPQDEAPLSFEDWLGLVHPDDRPRVAQHAGTFLANGGRYGDQFRIVRRDRSIVHVAAQAIAIKDSIGRVVRVVGTNRDVTAEFRAAADREQLLRRLQLATQVANIGVWESHLAEGTEQMDDACCRILGFGPGPQVRRAGEFLGLVHAADRPLLQAEHERALAGSASTIGPIAFRVVRDGEERHLLSHYAVERDTAGRARRVLGTVLDTTYLRRAEQAAKAAVERLEIATRLGGLGVFERDADDRFTYLDGVVRELCAVQIGKTGLAPEEVRADVLPEDEQRFLAARARMRETDEPVRCEYRMRTDDGRLRDILTWRRRRLDAAGRYAGEIGTLIDITELRAAERRAREYAAWLSIATGSAGMGVWELSFDDDQVVLDDRAHRLFEEQLDHAPAPIDRFLQLLVEDDRERLIETLRQARRQGGQHDFEFRAALPSGERSFAARGEVHRDERGLPLRLIGVVWDITERRAAEAAAREASDRLQLAAEGAGLGCWQRSLDGVDVLWDAQMYRLFGTTQDAGPPQRVFRDAVHAEDTARAEAARETALTTGVFSVDYRIRRADGELRWIASRGARRQLPSGRGDFIGVAWDITEARVAEAALRAKETAERASHAKSEFLSRMSHELRTPLNAIVGFTQLLELDHDDPLSATQRERVGLIRSSGWHLLNLINDVLDLARIESGRSSVSMEVVNWRPVLDDAVAMVQPEATARGIVMETRSAADAPATVWGDPVRLRQVLLNLLSNAVKYNRDHGSVQVSVRNDGGHVVFAVRDSGRGMSASQVDRLFQPFNRLGVELSAPAGTGIGLAISQRLVQQMEGAVEVDSQLGVGSEFRVRLRSARIEAAVPVVPAPPAANAALAMREDVAGTLLYIEDNPANSALVEQFLQFRPRVKLYQAADGATGLVMAAVCQPDLMLIDIRLPDMMGDEVLRELRRQPETTRIPCVAVSANAMPHDIDAALAAGFADYWTKPLDVARFLRGIDELLGSTSVQQRNVRGNAA